MDTFAPEFSRFWLPRQGAGRARRQTTAATTTRRQQTGRVEELAERVIAARSIV